MFKSVVRKVMTVFVLSGLPLAAYSDSYASVNLGFHDYEESVSGTPPLAFNSSLTSLYVRLGKQYTENFSAEVRFGVGLGDDPYEMSGIDTGLKLSIREFYGAYVRGGIQLNERLYPYVILGYTSGTLETGNDSFDFHDGYGGLSYGAGIDIEVKPELSASIEYINYFDTVGIELSALSLGLAKSF